MAKKKRRLIEIIFPKKKKSKQIIYLEKEIIRKNKIIAEIKEKNSILLKTSMKQSQDIIRLQNELRYINQNISKKE